MRRRDTFLLFNLMVFDATSHVGAGHYPVPPDMSYSWL